MIIHNFDPVLIDLGFFQLRWYSIAYILGIILGWIYANKIIKKTINKNDSYSVKQKDLDDLIVYIILGIIIGGRLGYIIFYNYNYYIQNPYEILQVWKGGMSFHGGLLGVVASILFFSRIKNINFFSLADVISCVAPIGLFLGRIANFINGELYGKISELPWSVVFPNVDNMARHPSQIYEAILEGILLFILLNYLVLKKNMLLKTGYISSIFLIFYSIFRILSESFREPDSHLGYFFNYLSMGTILSLITFISGCIIIIFIKKNEQNN